MTPEQLSIFDMCPNGGDASRDCADCVYGDDYHLVDGECIRRTYEPTDEKFKAPEEVCRR